MRLFIDRRSAVALQSRSRGGRNGAGGLVAGLLVAAAVAAGVAVPGKALAGDRVDLGAIIPGGAVELSPHRYMIGMQWEHLLKFYSKIYPTSRYDRIDIINQPSVKAIHLRNPEPSSKWEGLNIYETKGRVKIFVVARVPGSQPAPAKGGAKQKEPAKKPDA